MHGAGWGIRRTKRKEERCGVRSGGCPEALGRARGFQPTPSLLCGTAKPPCASLWADEVRFPAKALTRGCPQKMQPSASNPTCLIAEVLRAPRMLNTDALGLSVSRPRKI